MFLLIFWLKDLKKVLLTLSGKYVTCLFFAWQKLNMWEVTFNIFLLEHFAEKSSVCLQGS